MRAYYFVVLVVALLSCHAPVEIKQVVADTLVQGDVLMVDEPGVHLKAYKGDSGELQFDYTLKGNDTIKGFRFSYLDYSEVVFPEVAIGVLNGNELRKTKCLVVHDSLFIMPVIGMSGGLFVFIYDLRAMDMIAYDLRTAFELLWFNERQLTFVLAETPQEVNDSMYSYRLRKYQIAGGKVTEIGSDQVRLHIDSIHQQENIAKKELQ